MNGVVWPLEKSKLGVLNKFERRINTLRVQAWQLASRHGHTGRDVVLHLKLEGRQVILPETERPPGSIVVITHPKELGHQSLAPQAQLIGRGTVDDIDAKMRAPVLSPGGLPKAFHDEHQFPDVRRHRTNPGIVFIGKILTRRQELDDRTQSSTRTENRPLVHAIAGGIAEPLGKVASHDDSHSVEILRQVCDEDRTKEDGVSDGLRDLALAAARDRAGLVTQGSLRAGSDQAPSPRRHGRRLQMHPESAGQEVVMVPPESDGLSFSGIVPTDC